MKKNAGRYHYFTLVYHKWRSYDVWFLRYGARQTEFFVILDHFLPFYPPNNPENQNFEKIKKTPGDIILLHKCTIKTIIWCMVLEIWSATDRIFFVILGHFLPFYPPNSPYVRFIILHKCSKNHDHMLYCSWDMAHDGCNFYFPFWAIFCPFTPLTPWKIKISKKWKDIIILHMCTKNYDKMMHGSWDMVRNRRMEKVTYRGGCPT